LFYLLSQVIENYLHMSIMKPKNKWNMWNKSW